MIMTKQCIWSVVVEYFRLFRYGFLVPLRSSDDTDGCLETPSHASDMQEQLAFLHAAMTQDVVLGALHGVDALIEQWHRYSSYFGELHFELKRMETEPSGAMIASATLSVTITETTLRCVFPHLLDPGSGGGENEDSQLCARLVGQRIDCRCSVRFLWDDEIGRVTRLETNMDLLTPLLRVLGSLEDVAYVLTRALITPEYVIGERDSHLSIAFPLD
ncbi:hypothetical protein BBJ28_00025169 [Nothophytophthora sp. Chile5]|nr:hypothetical protein BBJ28_00025169 [Nothophytophthora sp. Chile5]